MTPALRTLTTLSVTLLAVAAPLRGQEEACPSASGVDAEAGWAAYAAGDLAEARGRFEAALARCPADHYARTGLGYVELRDGDAAEAERLWVGVVDAEPANVDALVGLGLARWRAGDIDAVRTHFSKVLDLAPDHPTALEYLERVTGNGAEPPPSEDPADVAWREGDTERAERLYRERLERDAQDPTAMLRLALLHGWSERHEEALALLDRLIDLEPRHVDARLARARVRAWSGDLGAARREVSQVLEVQPDNAEALEALALFQAWSGEIDASLASYEQLVSEGPSAASARRQQAQAMAWAADLEGSRAAYEELLARDPDDLEARLGLARTLAFGRGYDEAVAQYDAVLDHAPGEMRALTGKSRTLGWAGRLVAAERTARAAVEVDPASGEAWSMLGQVLRWQGRDADAREALETATRLEPTNAEARDQLRAIELALAPLARPTVVYESDSDGNRMITTSLTAGWHPVPRFELRLDGHYKDLDFGPLLRSAQGGTLSAVYQVRPGWTLGAAIGGSRSDGTDGPTAFEGRLSVRTPDRHRIGAGLAVSRAALNETAWLAELGTRSTEILMSARWSPAPVWRVDATVGVGRYEGTEPNGRRSASLTVSRRIGPSFSVGTSMRGFSFEKNLDDGYFDPDFYGVAELTSYWLHRPGPWTFLFEVAPGVQQITTDGDPGASVRTNTRVAYRVGQGREVSLSFRYSSAGLMTFATGGAGYRYTAFTLGSSWAF